jgi:hypothetical protein
MKMSDYKFQYVKPDDPTRCQGISKNGEQCYYKSVDGYEYCPRHLHNRKKKEMRRYLSEKWRATLDRHIDAEGVYNIREELGVLRLMLETVLNRAQDEQELELRAPQISDLVLKIERVVGTSVKLEEKLRNLLDAETVHQYAINVTNSVMEVLQDVEMSDKERDAFLNKLADKVEAISL